MPANTSGDPPQEFALQFARRPAADADLARLIDAWPNLPEAIRLAILALVETAGR